MVHESRQSSARACDPSCDRAACPRGCPSCSRCRALSAHVVAPARRLARGHEVGCHHEAHEEDKQHERCEQAERRPETHGEAALVGAASVVAVRYRARRDIRRERPRGTASLASAPTRALPPLRGSPQCRHYASGRRRRDHARCVHIPRNAHACDVLQVHDEVQEDGEYDAGRDAADGDERAARGSELCHCGLGCIGSTRDGVAGARRRHSRI